jgi:ribosomal protein S3
MEGTFSTYQQDNGRFGVTVTIIRKDAVPLEFTNQKNAKTEFEAIESTIKESVWLALLQ